jgi:hypothetical protein
VAGESSEVKAREQDSSKLKYESRRARESEERGEMTALRAGAPQARCMKSAEADFIAESSKVKGEKTCCIIYL